VADRTVLILGGAQSGPSAAARVRETDERARIILIERARDLDYADSGFAYHLSGEVPALDSLRRGRGDLLQDVYRVEVRAGAEVESIDPRQRRVLVDGQPLEYTALIYAAGAESLLPEVPGLGGAGNVFHFRTLRDLEGIVRRLGTGAARRVVILGGGAGGVDAADGLLRRGCDVTILQRGPRILPRFSPAMSRVAADALVKAGGKVVTAAEVTAAEQHLSSVSALRLANGLRIETDVVIVAAGLRPRTALLRKAGASLLADGAVAVDERCETSLKGIYACGTCVALPHAVTSEPAWSTQAAQADKSAQVAAINAAGGKARMPPVTDTILLRVGDIALGRTGLTRDEAAARAGRKAAAITVHAPCRDPYLREADLVTIDIYYHRGSGRLLGAEAAGRAGVDKRLDVLATALRGGLTVDDLGGLDLAYAPAYAPARDPVNVAGTVAAAVRSGAAPALSVEDIAARPGAVTLVDVRSEPEPSAGTIPGARLVPLASLRDGLEKLPKGKLVFFCDSGQRGYLAARIARQRGRRDAGFLSGGLRSWRAAGQPVTPPVPATPPPRP